MKAILSAVSGVISGDTGADRVVPPSGPAVWLTVITSAAMAFLAVLALAMSLATVRLADRWTASLSGRATIHISAAPEVLPAQTQLVLDILAVTPGVSAARAIAPAETKALLAPWFEPDFLIDGLPIPQLIDIEETAEGFDTEGLSLRLAAEVPGATLDDHQRWRKPLVRAAKRIGAFADLSLVLIAGAMAAMITLAAQAALATNAKVIGVLHLIGARDAFITRAFVRRYTLRTAVGAAFGTFVGMIAIATMPGAAEEGGFLTGLGFSGWQWIWPLAIPVIAAIIAFWATRMATLRTLRRVQ